MFNDHFLEGFPPCNQLSEYNFALSLRCIGFIVREVGNASKCEGFGWIYNPLYNTEIVAPQNMTKRFHRPNVQCYSDQLPRQWSTTITWSTYHHPNRCEVHVSFHTSFLCMSSRRRSLESSNHGRDWVESCRLPDWLEAKIPWWVCLNKMEMFFMVSVERPQKITQIYLRTSLLSTVI